MASIQDGTWAFDDTGVIYKNEQVGRVEGWVIIEGGDIAEVWVEDKTQRLTQVAPGSWFANALVSALRDDLPEYIAFQASSKSHWRRAAAFKNAIALARGSP